MGWKLPQGRDTTLFTTSLIAVCASGIGILLLYRENQILKQQLNNTAPAPSSSGGPKSDKKAPEDKAASKRCTEEFIMEEIGCVLSPFPQRAGCPRQGTLAPHVKSHIVLHQHMPRQVLDGITDYSHVWIIFSFHLNPRGKARSSQSGSETKQSFKGAKVRPPRANGLKVGVLATRAPHRPNPVGLSLALLESIEIIKDQGRSQVCLVVKGLDLVDGTPVFDIKPYVPWDRIAAAQASTSSSDMQRLRVPSWVAADDELAEVEWTSLALSSLSNARDLFAPLYPPTKNGIEQVRRAISEIVAQDPRAVRDGRGTCASNDDIHDEAFEFTFGALRVSFVVQSGRVASVTQISIDEGDLGAAAGSYPHNVALRQRAQREAAVVGRTLVWKFPVREGVTDGLFDLRDGGTWSFNAS